MYIIIARWMTHPLFLLFAIVVNLFIGDYANVFIWIFIWLFLNLIFGRNSYLYKLWKRVRLEKSEKEIIERIAKKHPEQYYKLWGGVEGKVKKNNKKGGRMEIKQTEADLGEKYISAYRINSSTLADIYKEFTQSTSDIKERKISMSEYKILVKKHIESINACNRLYLQLKPPKRFKKVNDLLGKNFEHLLKRNSYLQDFIDTQDIKKMAIYLGQSADENYSANIYAAKAANKMYKLIEK